MGTFPSDPPKDAKLYDCEDIPVAVMPDGSLLAFDPSPRPYPASGLRMAFAVSRDRWDELRAFAAGRRSTSWGALRRAAV